MMRITEIAIHKITARISSPTPPDGISPIGRSGKLGMDFKFGVLAILPKLSFNLKPLYRPQTINEKKPRDNIVVDNSEFAKRER